MSVLRLLSSTKHLVKVRRLEEKEVIDNAITRCHYVVTAVFLFVSCALSSASSMFGNPINCISGRPSRDFDRVVNTYCWIMSTFTLPTHHNKPIGTHVVSHGVGPYVPDEDEPVYHNYYQWVPFTLFFLGMLFYLPHYVWKNWEAGTLGKISSGLRGFTTDNRDKRLTRQQRLLEYLVESTDLHFKYAVGYVLCEFLNLVNVVGAMLLLNRFLGGSFLEYGFKVLDFVYEDQENRTDPMIAVFPRITKCLFHKYGPSGTIEQFDMLCVLPFNIVNEKIFIFLWFWFLILAVLTILSLLYTVFMLISPCVRRAIIQRRFKFTCPEGSRAIVRRLKVGDFILLHLLGQNMCRAMFTDLLAELSSKLNNYNALPTTPATESTLPFNGDSVLNNYDNMKVPPPPFTSIDEPDAKGTCLGDYNMQPIPALVTKAQVLQEESTV